MKHKFWTASGMLLASAILSVSVYAEESLSDKALRILSDIVSEAETVNTADTETTEDADKEETSANAMTEGSAENAASEDKSDSATDADPSEDTANKDDTENAASSDETEGAHNEDAATEGSEYVSPEELASQGSLDDKTFESRYRAGEYLGGDTIPEGEYMLFAYSDDASVTSGYRTDSSYTTTSATFTYNYICVVSEGAGLTLNDCWAVPINSVDPEALDLKGPGMYKAAMHFAPGNYSLVPGEGGAGFYKIFSAITPEEVYQSGEVTGDVNVRLSSGQYILLSGCSFKTAPSPAVITYSDKETVKRVQAQLTVIGYDCGTPDGLLGRKTSDAITKFQQDHGLNPLGKITAQTMMVLDQESPYEEVAVEMGPFIADTKDFVARYNEAAALLKEAEDFSFSQISEGNITSGSFTPNENGGYVLDTNKMSTKIRGGFYVKKGVMDRKSVLELSLLLYGLDSSYADTDAAISAALRLLFDGSLEMNGMTADMVDLNENITAWVRVPEEEVEVAAPQ